MPKLRALSLSLAATAAMMIAGCAVRTYYVKNSYQPAVSEQVGAAAWMMPAHLEDVGYSFSCLNANSLRHLIGTDDDLAPIRADQPLTDKLVCSGAWLFSKEHVDCDSLHNTPSTPPGSCPAFPTPVSTPLPPPAGYEPQCPPPAELTTNSELLNPPVDLLFHDLAKQDLWQTCLQVVSPPNMCEAPKEPDQYTRISYQPYNEWAFLTRSVLCDNEGLFSEWADWGPRDLTITTEQWWLPRDRQVAASLKPESRIARLALSSHPPSVPESKEGFSALPERAQAAAINAVASGAKDKDSGKSIKDSVASLLKPAEPAFSQKQKVELTFSGSLNSASTRDRFEYLAAYLSIPPLAGKLNGGVSLEKQFLIKFMEFYLARSEQERSSADPGGDVYHDGLVNGDMRTALDELTVHVDAIDNTATQSTLINLGSLTTSSTLSASMGAPPTAPLAASGSASLSASRVENIAKELDRRSVWISRDRSTFKITQRGMMEATIAGSIVSVVTLKIPVTSLYVLGVTTEPQEDKDAAPAAPSSGSANPAPGRPPASQPGTAAAPPGPPANVPSGEHASSSSITGTESEKEPARPVPKPKPTPTRKPDITKLELKGIDQPLYREVDGMQGIIATARISAPASLTNFFDVFQKEPDGYDFTALEGPAPLKLWENPRVILGALVSDLPEIPSDDAHLDLIVPAEMKYESLAIRSDVPPVRQAMTFKETDSATQFFSSLRDGSLGLVKVAQKNGHHGQWYQFVSCGSKEGREKAKAESSFRRDEPGPGEIWLGVVGNKPDTNGLVTGFPADLHLENIYECCRKLAGVKKKCT